MEKGNLYLEEFSPVLLVNQNIFMWHNMFALFAVCIHLFEMFWLAQ